MPSRKKLPVLLTCALLLALAALAYVLAAEKHEESHRAARVDDTTAGGAGLEGRHEEGVPLPSSAPPISAGPAAQSDSAYTTVLSGRVLDTAGAAVRGARVTAGSAEALESDSERAVLGWATSAADGHWRIEIAGRPPSSLGLIATAPGLQSREFVLNTGGVSEHLDLIVSLHPLARLTCSVVSGDSELPVAGVRIGVSSSFTVGLPSSKFAQTNSRGVCEFDVPRGPCSVRAYLGGGHAPGVHVFVPAKGRSVSLDVPSSLRQCTLVLEGGSAGKTAFEASSVVVSAFGSTARRKIQDGSRSAELSFPGGAADGPVRVSVATAEAPPLSLEFGSWSEAVREGELRVNLGQLSSGAIEVRSAESGEPLPLLRIRLRRRSPDHWSIALRTDENGSAEYAAPAGVYDAILGQQVIARAVQLPVGTSGDLQIELAGYGVLRGRLGESLRQQSMKGRYLRVSSEFPRSDIGRDTPGSSRPLRFNRKRKSRPLTIRLNTASWAVAVPWPRGTRVSVSLRTSRAALSDLVDAEVGGAGVALQAGDIRFDSVTIRPVLSGVYRPEGYVIISREDLLAESEGGRVRPQHVALVDRRTGLARFNDVPEGEYFVFYSEDRSARSPAYRARATIRVRAADAGHQIVEVPLGASR